MGYAIEIVFGFEYTMIVRDSVRNATSASQSFYTHGVDMDCRFQIWSTQNWNNIHPFKLSSRLYQWGRTREQCKVQVHMLVATKKWEREIALSILDYYFSKFGMLNTNWPSFFWSLLFFENPTFLHNIIFHHNLNIFELLSCKYNCNSGPKDKIDNLLALIEDMVFGKNPLDKRGKAIWKVKSKTWVTIENNGGS